MHGLIASLFREHLLFVLSSPINSDYYTKTNEI